MFQKKRKKGELCVKKKDKRTMTDKRKFDSNCESQRKHF